MTQRDGSCLISPRTGWLPGLRLIALSAAVCLAGAIPVNALERDDWAENLEPIPRAEFAQADLAHILERAGFGATQAELERLSGEAPRRVVRQFTRPSRRLQRELPGFDHSGVFEPALATFPPSRPATTNLAKTNGQALGIAVKPGGNRPIQPVVNQFFYWLRASRLETDRVAYWWANRMLSSKTPLTEKVALFWHGHFATNEDKVRDYRKMLQQVELFQQSGLGKFRALMIGVAQNPAMLKFLDAGVNVKGAPNENFAREIMELFTMGVGHYSEQDVREAARAFTGWNSADLEFYVDAAKHDNGPKTFLGVTRNFDGVEIIDAILEQDATARFLASKLYRYFVREQLSEEFADQLGSRFKALDYDVARFLELVFLSKDFYAPESVGTRIKPPVELLVSTYRKMGLDAVPGVPDFNQLSAALGQRLLHPPTVAGWSQGRSWITPSLLFERGNFVLDLVFPDIAFVPPDRYPSYGANIISVHKRLRAGEDITSATTPPGMAAGAAMAASNQLADRDEAFNTRYGSYRGWQMAIERVKPIVRTTARLRLSEEVAAARLKTPASVVDYFTDRFFSVSPEPADKARLATYLEEQLGTANIQTTQSFSEEALRSFLHLLLSLPEYQLG